MQGAIEPIAEEDGEESKYMPTPQKPLTSKADGMKAIECVKALKAKELEKRLDPEDTMNNRIEKTFKSADAQKPKATIKDNMSNKQLPPKVPNGRSSTSNENAKTSTIPTSYLKTYHKAVPSTTKASTVAETPKSVANSVMSYKPKAQKGNTLNESKNSIDNGSQKGTDPATVRALMLYETPTVASQHKKQDVYKPEESLPAWGIQRVDSKNINAKRTTSATTRSTITPRNHLKRNATST